MDLALQEPGSSPRGALRPYAGLVLPASMRIPRWLGGLAIGAAAAGALVGAARAGARTHRLLRAFASASAACYGVVACLDLAEHLRMEKELTGHYLRWDAVPLRESAVHAAIISVNVSSLALARPVRKPERPHEFWVLAAPAVFLALGWIDELAFHRRRATHREDIIHTTEHLAEGVMWTTHYALRFSRDVR